MRPLVLSLVSATVAAASARALEPIPDKLVVLTFDDSSRSHIAVAAPLQCPEGRSAPEGIVGNREGGGNKQRRTLDP